MDYEKLIALYYCICDCYDTKLVWHCQRFSNNSTQAEFTDAELLTVYIYSVSTEEKYKVKSIHNYAKKYLKDWFPTLPSYQAFNRRLNRINNVFPYLAAHLLSIVEVNRIHLDLSIVDSMPIITCSGKRKGKVATELTDKGYCSTKKLHYFGVKLHTIGFYRNQQLPFPEFFNVSKASEHDLNAVREIFLQFTNRAIYADKAYAKKDLQKQLVQQNNTTIYTPIKLVKGDSENTRQFKFAADKIVSTAVSKVRQPIESLFNWLIDKTDIQRANKVRSTKGLIVHIFGKIAAAVSLWSF